MKQFKCKQCAYQFDEPETLSVSYREHYGSKLWTDHYEACPKCHGTRLEQLYCLLDGPEYPLVNQDEIERDEYDFDDDELY